MSLFDYNLKYTRDCLSHEVSEFADYLFDRRFKGGFIERSVNSLSEKIDESLETEQDMVRYGVNTEADSKAFATETFGRFYEDSPKVTTNEWSQVQDAIWSLPEAQSLVSSVKGDADLSVLATSHLLDIFRDEVPDILKEARTHKEEEKKREKPCNPGSTNEGDGSVPGVPGGSEDTTDQEPDKGFELSKELRDKIMSKGCKLGDISEQMKKFKGTISAAGNMFSNGSGNDEDRSQLVKDLISNSGLRYIFKMMGRLKAIMNSIPAYEFNEELREQVVTVGRAGFTDLLQSEQMLLADPFTTDIFLDRWIRRNQMRWRKRGKTSVGSGPITLLLDESGSMMGPQNQMASAFAAALATLCVDENREFNSCGFNRRITSTTRILKSGKSFIKTYGDRYRPVKASKVVLHLAQRHCDGGTCFDDPLEWAINISGTTKKADIILLTDGSARVSNDILEQLKKKKKEDGMRVFTILVGGAVTNSVSNISDGVACVNDLNDIHSLSALARLMKVTMNR